MSNQIFPITVRPFLLALIGSVTLPIGIADINAQSEGFSIFDAPAEKAVQKVAETFAPTVSPQEAFTNPNATLPKSQFGSFAGSDNTRTPNLEGAKPIGIYARSAAQSLPSNQRTTSSLPSLVTNSLRPSSGPQSEKTALASVPATPIRSDDFPPSTRRLSAAPANTAATQGSAEAPRVAQVAFQDGGGFNPRAGQGAPPNRFQPGAGQTGARPNRFSFGNNNSSAASGQAAPAPANPAQQPTRQTNAFQQSAPRTGQPQAVQGFSAQTPRPNNTNRSKTPRNSGFDRNAQGRSPSGFGTSRGQGSVPSQAQNSRQPARNPRAADSRSNEGQASRQQSPKANPASAKELLNAWVTVDSQQEIPGKRMKFYEFLGQPINGSKKDAINQYWVTFADLARYRIAIQQTEWLKSVSKPRQESEQAILAAAQQAAQNRVLHTEIQLAKSQSILSDFLSNLRQNGKPVAVIPSNIPWVGKLNTKLDEYQRRGMVPTRFGTINDYLPKARTLIANEAEAVIASGKAADQARSAMKSGQTAVANVLEAARMKERNEEEFLGAVLGYNRAITDYVLSVRQDINQPKRLAAVLIGRKSVELVPTTASKPKEDLDSRSGFSQTQRSTLDGNRTNAFSQASARTSGQTRVAAKGQIQYGPTVDSAKAANFDPSKLKEELPMQQLKPNSNSGTYGSNDRANTGTRAASNPASASRRFNNQATTQPASSRGTANPRGGAGGFSGQPAGQGAASSVPSIPNTPRGSRAPGRTFNGYSTSTPRVGSFTGAAAQPAVTGGGTFGGAAAASPSVPSTASGFPAGR